jgi:hypothetical protein
MKRKPHPPNGIVIAMKTDGRHRVPHAYPHLPRLQTRPEGRHVRRRYPSDRAAVMDSSSGRPAPKTSRKALRLTSGHAKPGALREQFAAARRSMRALSSTLKLAKKEPRARGGARNMRARSSTIPIARRDCFSAARADRQGKLSAPERHLRKPHPLGPGSLGHTIPRYPKQNGAALKLDGANILEGSAAIIRVRCAKCRSCQLAPEIRRFCMLKPEKLTVVVEPETRAELAEWAREEGRPVGNLLRRIVCKSVEQRRQGLQRPGEVAA